MKTDKKIFNKLYSKFQNTSWEGRYLIGQNNVGQKWRKVCPTKNYIRQKIMSDEKFVQGCLHLHAISLEKKWRNLLRWRKFCPALFCRIR